MIENKVLGCEKRKAETDTNCFWAGFWSESFICGTLEFKIYKEDSCTFSRTPCVKNRLASGERLFISFTCLRLVCFCLNLCCFLDTLPCCHVPCLSLVFCWVSGCGSNFFALSVSSIRTFMGVVKAIASHGSASHGSVAHKADDKSYGYNHLVPSSWRIYQSFLRAWSFKLAVLVTFFNLHCF